MRGVIAGLVLVSAVGRLATAGPADEIPAAFLPFEHMVGGWKGTAAPAANKVKILFHGSVLGGTVCRVRARNNSTTAGLDGLAKVKVTATTVH